MTLRGWTRFGLALACACSAGSSGGGGSAPSSPAGAGGRADVSGGVGGAGRAGAASGAPSAGAAPQPAGAGGSLAGAAAGGATAGSSGTSASSAGSSGSGARCDFIEACRDVAADCGAALGSDCGRCKLGTFGCGDVIGFYSNDGHSFPCVPTDMGNDCTAAVKASSDHCFRCGIANAGAGGGVD